MIHLLFVFLALAQGVHPQETAADTTNPNCPPFDGTARTIWRILGTCAVTLVICVWQAIHDDVPPPKQKWYQALLAQMTIILSCFLLPEWMVYTASKQWRKARQIVQDFRAKNDTEWSMAHSFFAQMGGFVYCDENGPELSIKIKSDEYLRLRTRGAIANPDITEDDIKDKSKADALGKAIHAIQLIWFTLQVTVRHFSGYAVTLVELDTVCMSVLSVLLLVYWHNKPLRPKCPHIFYSKQYLEKNPDFGLKEAWGSESGALDALIARFSCTRTDKEEEVPVDEKVSHPLLQSYWRSVKRQQVDTSGVAVVSLCATWFIFGALHLAAWDYPFEKDAEKMTWRTASIALAAAPLVVSVEKGLSHALTAAGVWKDDTSKLVERKFMFFSLLLALLCRLSLAVLMFYSLRSVPCSAYYTVTWTTYIPHI